MRCYPPRFLERALRLVLPAGVGGESIVGDLRQEYSDVAERAGDRAADLWYAREIAALGIRYLWFRVLSRDPARPFGQSKEKRGSDTMMSYVKEFMISIRVLRRKPGLVLIAALALSLGIGLTTAMFGLVQGLLLSGLPFEDGNRIVAVVRSTPSAGLAQQTIPIDDYAEYLEQQKSFAAMGAFTNNSFNISTDEGNPERLIGAQMTPSAFRLLREQPVIGRLLRDEDAISGAPRVALIGYDVWRDRFAFDSSVTGQTMHLDGYETSIIGVMPDGFEFPAAHRVWIPLEINPAQAKPGAGALNVFGRLADGVSIEEANVEFGLIADRMAAEHPQTHEGVTLKVMNYVQQFIGPQSIPLLYAMVGAGVLVLLVACANVANLLLARAVGRSREMAIRTAIGADRKRLVFTYMIEAAVLVLIGGVGGFLVGQLGLKMIYDALAVQVLPFWFKATVDPTVIAFSLGLMLLATLLAGGIPALKASGADLNEVLKDEARGSSSLRMGRLSRGLVVVEVAFSTALLVAAGFMIQSTLNLSQRDHGFVTSNILTATISPGDGDFPDDAARVRFYEDIVKQARGIPRVVTAGVASQLPLVGFGQAPYEVEGREYANEQKRPVARFVTTSPGVFAAFDIKLLEGRLLEETDRAATLPVVVANRDFVKKEFGDESAIGKRVRFPRSGAQVEWATIVGVVQDVYLDGELAGIRPSAVYRPLEQGVSPDPDNAFIGGMNIVVRSTGDPTGLTAQLRAIVAQRSKNIPLFQVQTFDTSIKQLLAGVVTIGGIFAVLGLVSVLLAAVGLYGVMSFHAGQRTREVGIRMAFGAKRKDAFLLILRSAIKQLSIGLVIGLVLGQLLAGGLQSFMYEVSLIQPGIMFGVAAILFVTGMLATAVPARLASRVDPIIAIRDE